MGATPVRFSSNVLARAGVTAALAVGLATAIGTAANAAPAPAVAPAVAVTPASGLADGADVAVTGSGLAAADVYHVGECAQVAPDTLACDRDTAVDVTSTADGTLDTTLVVHQVFQGSTGADGTPWGTVDCAAVSCFVGVFDAAFNGGAVPI